MTVHKKLMQARVKLQGTELKKSGFNKFANYSYFELGDFLPNIQAIFNELGLCGVVSYTTEYATLTITDVEDGTVIVITSPMAEAQLKGTHPIQNLGAVETYSRRYLWMTAMEIVEHDVLDATTGHEEPNGKPVSQKKPEPQKAAPTRIEGKEQPWQLKVEAKPGGDFNEWCDFVLEATGIMLGNVSSESDVMAIFRTNKNIFDQVQSGSPESYDKVLSMFKAAKEQHKKGQ